MILYEKMFWHFLELAAPAHYMSSAITIFLCLCETFQFIFKKLIWAAVLFQMDDNNNIVLNSKYKKTSSWNLKKTYSAYFRYFLILFPNLKFVFEEGKSKKRKSKLGSGGPNSKKGRFKSQSNDSVQMDVDIRAVRKNAETQSKTNRSGPLSKDGMNFVECLHTHSTVSVACICK